MAGECFKVGLFWVLFCVMVCVIVTVGIIGQEPEQEALPSWHYWNGYGISSCNVFEEEFRIECSCCCCLEAEHFEYSVPNTPGLSRLSGFIDFLIFLTSLFGCNLVSENGTSSGNKVLSSGLMMLMILTVLTGVWAIMLMRSLAKRKRELAVKIGDRGKADDQEERSLSKELPLGLMVKLRKTAAQEGGGMPLPKGEKGGRPLAGFFDRPAFHHCFAFRGDQEFRQTVTACPAVTSTFSSHFVSGSFGQPDDGSLELNKEGVRLATFRHFPPNVPVSALRLAQAGFFYEGERDLVKCFVCNKSHEGWQAGDRPAMVHARISPSCALVRGSDTSNLPLPLPVTSLPSFAPERSLDSGYYGSVPPESSTPGGLVEPDGSAAPSSSSTLSQPESSARAQVLASSASYSADSVTSQSAPAQPEALATPENSMFSGAPAPGHPTSMDSGASHSLPLPTRRLDLGGAVYPLYSQVDARRRSFSNWTHQPGLPSVDELIGLGFFYAGYADCVRCFFCGIGLKSWESDDIPAEVHARWRPTCEYLRLVKGDVFVDTVANGGRTLAGPGVDLHSHLAAPGLEVATLRHRPPAAPALVSRGHHRRCQTSQLCAGPGRADTLTSRLLRPLKNCASSGWRQQLTSCW
ncbi:uncharacterized protein LOC143282997 isoform X2 [Babylonia areolata]|uniref:uncharacterized protein LOC143282997 isoform X2 n=1 Tax=Babylonia areolata TaxID=304850 RepID=UPI003FD3509B